MPTPEEAVAVAARFFDRMGSFDWEAMGACVADFNQDGLLDLFKTNFTQDYNNMYLGHRMGSGKTFFRDVGLGTMGQAVFYDLSWGCGWHDLDGDGDLELYVANGHVYKEVDQQPEMGATYDQYNALFECVDAKALGYRECRVRLHEGELARIEVPAAELERLLDPAVQAGLTRQLRELGFQFVTLDLEGFRSGSLNTLVPLEKKRLFTNDPIDQPRA